MARKTIDVAEVTRWVNIRLGVPDSTHRLEGAELTPEQAFRLGAASLLEQILHATGNYRGFGYHEPYVKGETDETRRHYY